MFGLTEEEIRRYSRQIVLKDVGGKGQKKLKDSSVLIVGAGGLGCPAAFYLAASGIGRIGILDFDTVDLSNLQRQILHFTTDIGHSKTASAAEKLRSLNPLITVEAIDAKLEPKNARSVVKQYDFIIDGSDNFATKYIINDACIAEEKTFTIAGILKFNGQILTVIPKQTACYRCIFPSPPPLGFVPSCSQAGVFGVIPGIVGSIQAGEAIKYLLGLGRLITNGPLFIDIGNLDFQTVTILRDENCRACGKEPEDLLNFYDYYQVEVCEV
jgi:molybdopterin/thiamine biosynthesis adenylyltransferase